MQVCSGGRGAKSHDEIVYEANDCPFCDYMSDKQGEIDNLKEEIAKLEDEPLYEEKED